MSETERIKFAFMLLNLLLFFIDAFLKHRNALKPEQAHTHTNKRDYFLDKSIVGKYLLALRARILLVGMESSDVFSDS